MDPRVEVDHAECVSSGACVLEAPAAFGYQDGPEALSDRDVTDFASLEPSHTRDR
jgi:ferredoxin